MWELTEQGALRDKIWMANPGTATNKGHLHLCGRDQCVDYIISTTTTMVEKKNLNHYQKLYYFIQIISVVNVSVSKNVVFTTMKYLYS